MGAIGVLCAAILSQAAPVPARWATILDQIPEKQPILVVLPQRFPVDLMSERLRIRSTERFAQLFAREVVEIEGVKLLLPKSGTASAVSGQSTLQTALAQTPVADLIRLNGAAVPFGEVPPSLHPAYMSVLRVLPALTEAFLADGDIRFGLHVHADVMLRRQADGRRQNFPVAFVYSPGHPEDEAPASFAVLASPQEKGEILSASDLSRRSRRESGIGWFLDERIADSLLYLRGQIPSSAWGPIMRRLFTVPTPEPVRPPERLPELAYLFLSALPDDVRTTPNPSALKGSGLSWEDVRDGRAVPLGQMVNGCPVLKQALSNTQVMEGPNDLVKVEISFALYAAYPGMGPLPGATHRVGNGPVRQSLTRNSISLSTDPIAPMRPGALPPG
jgi:hypothetical protein